MPQRLLIHGISSKTGDVEQGRTGDGSCSIDLQCEENI